MAVSIRSAASIAVELSNNDRTIRSFREAFPLVSLTLEEFLSNSVHTCLVDPEGLVITPLLEEPMVAALPEVHAPAQGDGSAALSLRRLADKTFILYGLTGTGSDVTFAECRAAGFTPRIGQYALRITSTLSLVAVGLGISCHFDAANGHGRCNLPPAQKPLPKFVLYLASRRGAASAIVRHFLTLVKRAAKGFRRDRV